MFELRAYEVDELRRSIQLYCQLSNACSIFVQGLGFVAQMYWWDSLYESSVMVEGDEQLGPYEI
jgi:hypothetical protein